MIEKSSSTEIRRVGDTFTVLSNAAIETLGSDSLAVYTYLMSRPEDWTIRVKDICRRFGWGEKGVVWRRAAKGLRDAGYLFDVVERDENGRVIGRQMCCATVAQQRPVQSEEDLGVKNQHPGKNHLGHKNQHPSDLGVGFQRAGKSTHLLNTEYLLSTPAESESGGGSTTECVDWSATLTQEAWG